MKRFVFLIAIIGCVAVFIYGHGKVIAAQREKNNRGSFREKQYRDVMVTEVITGDTLRLETGDLVRLIGVDTPEAHKSSKQHRDARITGIPIAVLEVMANEAANFTKQLVKGKTVAVEFDTQRTDNYGVLVGYVFVVEEDLFVNAEIIKKGYTSYVDTTPNKRYDTLFRKLHKQTQKKVTGLWRRWMR